VNRKEAAQAIDGVPLPPSRVSDVIPVTVQPWEVKVYSYNVVEHPDGLTHDQYRNGYQCYFGKHSALQQTTLCFLENFMVYSQAYRSFIRGFAGIHTSKEGITSAFNFRNHPLNQKAT
jgi:hypothetical protein